MALPQIVTVFFDVGDTLVVSADRNWVPGAKQVLAELGTRGLQLGVISNTGALSRAQLMPLLPVDFDWALFGPSVVILSGEVGIEKPDPAIFQLAVARAQSAAAECLFCTESLVDALAAQTVGMRAVRLQPPPRSDVGTLIAALIAAGLAH